MNPGTTDVLQNLPATLDWAVLFALPPLRHRFPETLLRAAFAIPPTQPLDGIGHVALTSAGPHLVGGDGTPHPVDPARTLPPRDGASLADRFGDRLHLVPARADCLGVGAEPGRPPVLLHVILTGRPAPALAVLDQAPDTNDYWLLDAVGVTYRGGRPGGRYFLARFDLDLDRHLHAAAASGFHRTAHCNQFFLHGATVTPRLARGLKEAARQATGRTAAALRAHLAAALRADPAPTMTCQPPGDAPTTGYGDLVPAGLARLALPAGDPDPIIRAARAAIDTHLRDLRAPTGLWPFHHGGLPTATDTAFITAAAPDRAAVHALDTFYTPAGYLPQTCGPPGTAGVMPHAPGTRHWNQPDLVTTCLIRHLHTATGTPTRVPLTRLYAALHDRAGMFTTNPFLVDWAYAQALIGDRSAAPLRRALAGQVAHAVNPDGTFGAFDPGLSTALAVVTLTDCGFGGDLVRHAQLRLRDLATSGLAGATVFHSTILIDPADIPAGATMPPGVLRVGPHVHAVTYYRDTNATIATALTALALSRDPTGLAPPVETGQPHPRYRCTRTDYLTRHALPHYGPPEADPAAPPPRATRPGR